MAGSAYRLKFVNANAALIGMRFTQLLGADNAYKASFNLVCTAGYTFNALLRAIKLNLG